MQSKRATATHNLTTTIEYLVTNENNTLIRSHRWEPKGDGTALSVLREWAWNYRTKSYSDDRHTMEIEITPEALVEHDGRSLAEYAKARVAILTRKRGIREPTVRRVA